MSKATKDLLWAAVVVICAWTAVGFVWWKACALIVLAAFVSAGRQK